MPETQLARLDRAHTSIATRAGGPAGTAIMLGSGLGHLADAVANATIIPYAEIEGFPVSTALGHKGQLVIGNLHGRRVVVMQGRLHLFEGWEPRDIALAVYLLQRLGAKTLVVTNAAGGLNTDYDAGDVMLIEDHLNFTGHNPLRGPNDDAIGLRFPDMSRCYDPKLLAKTAAAADKAGVVVRRGIYASVLGPSLETSAERRWLRASGGDAVGMSTVMEVIAAAHCGMKAIGLSGITNKATGGADQKVDTVEDIFAHAEICGRKMDAILAQLLPELAAA